MKNIEVYFYPLVLDFFNSNRQVLNDAPETGGYLFGKIINNKILISGISEAEKPDIKERFNFKFNVKEANKKIKKRVSSSNNDFIGDWHTHPEKYATPSSQDYEGSKILFENLITEIPLHLSVVIGQEQDDIYTYIVTKENLNPKKINIVDFK